MTDTKKYYFYINMHEGDTVQWTGLTKHKAQSMYRWTEEALVAGLGVKEFGWGEVK